LREALHQVKESLLLILLRRNKLKKSLPVLLRYKPVDRRDASENLVRIENYIPRSGAPEKNFRQYVRLFTSRDTQR
jgi:hypothetical protein